MVASILDHPESHRASEQATVDEKPVGPFPTEAHGYSKTGPGPIAAIRFRWTVRRDEHGEYYVDETIGESSMPVVSGPMPGDAAIRWVNDRESEARRRFEALKNEMSGRTTAANLVRKDVSEV